MGRKTDFLLRGFLAAKCLTLLKLATGRIKVMRNKRSIAAKQMRGEIAHLLKSGQDAHVYITKADALIKQENMVAVFDIIDHYCHAIIARFPTIEMQGTCPIDMRGPIASLIYAAPRCPEISELASIKEAFIAKYGKEFAGAASELRPDSGVDKQVIELLSTRPATGDTKLKIMKEICAEYKVDWTPGEALGGPSTSTPAGSSQQTVKASMDAKKVTGDAGSTKATPAAAAPVRIGQAGPSNFSAYTNTTVQGASKHEGTNKSGNVAMDPSKYPSTKHAQGDSGRAKETAAQSVKGDTTPWNLGANFEPPAKASLKSNDASASNPSSTKHVGGDLAKANERPSQSLTGASTTAPLGTKFGLVAAKESLKRADGAVVFPSNPFKSNDTKQGGMGRVSFSTLQTGKGERNTEASTASSGYIKESKVEAAPKPEHDVQPVVADSQDGSSDSDNDSFVSVEEGLKDDAEISSMGGAARRESFGKSSVQASVHDNVIGPSLIKKPSRETRENVVGTVSIPEDAYSKPSNEGSSLTSSQEYAHLKASRTNSLNTAASPPPEENIFRAESRKSSFREDNISGLAMESSLESTFLRASNKNNLSMDGLPEDSAFTAGSRKTSLKEKQVAGEQSFKQVREDILTKQQQSFKVGVEEGVLTKGILEDGSPGLTSGIPQTMVEAHPSEESLYTLPEKMRDNGLQRKDFKEDTTFVAIAAESLGVENVVGIKNADSLSHRISAEEIPAEFGEELSIERTSPDIHELPESVSKLVDKMPSIHKGVQELIGSSSSGALAASDYGQDFAAAAKAIAAEAARLAVLDYAKRIAGSSSIPVDLPDLTNLGLDFEGTIKVSQEMTNLNSVGNNEVANNQEAQYGGDSKKDVISEEASKVEFTVHGDEGNTVDEMGGIKDADAEKSVRSNTLAAVDEGESNHANQKDDGHVWPSTKEKGSLQQSKIASGDDDINPFASRNDKATNSLFVSIEDDVQSSWVTTPQPEGVSKAGGFGQEEDHLDVFFKRKTPRFDEDGYVFGNATSSFLAERVSFLDHHDKKESIFQDKFVASPMFGSGRKVATSQEIFAATPVFDSLPESSPSMPPLEEERSGSFKVPVFDDEGPEYDDASFSLDDGFNKSNFSVGLPNLQQPLSPRKEMPSARFDLEPEPSFDKMVDKEEQFGSEKIESTPAGQLKWQSNKPTRASDQGETVASDASLGGANNRLSRRTRKQPQRINEQEYGGSDISPAPGRRYTDEGLTSKRPQVSSSTLVQQQLKEQGRRDKYDVAEQGTLRTRPPESYAYSSDAVNRRPWSSPKRDNQVDRWDSTSTYAEDRLSSGGSTKSPVRSPLQQRISPPQRRMSPLQQRVTVEGGDEDFYFDEETASISSGNNRSKRSTKSPTRVGMPQPRVQSHDNDDEEAGYNLRNKPLRVPTSSQKDLFEHESNEEEPSARSKPLRQRVDLGKGASAGVGMYRQKQHLQTEVYEPESLHTQYVQVSSDSRSRLPTHRKQDLIEEESYQPSVKVHDLGKDAPSRPLSSRRKGEGEQPYLTSVFNSSAQGDDLGRISSNPRYGRRPKQGYHEEEEQGLSMAQHEQEEFHPMRSPDRHQGERRKEKERMPRTSYGQKQDSRVEDERLHSFIEVDEWQQDVKIRPLPSYSQEKQRRPAPRLPQYEQDEEGEEFDSMQLPDWQQEERRKEEERMPRSQYGWKQDSIPERKYSSLSMEDYEQQQEEQRRPSMLSAQEQDKQRRPSPYGHRLDSKFKKDSRETLQQDNIQQEQKRPASDGWQQQHIAEQTAEKQQQGRENERLPSPVYTRQQERYEREKLSGSSKDQQQEEDQLQPSTSLLQGKQEHDGQGNENRPWPSHGRKQQSKFEEEKSESRPQKETHYQQQDKLTVDGRKQKSQASEESMKGPQEKTQVPEQLPAGQSIVAKDEEVKRPQEKPDIRTQPPTRRPPSLPAQSTSPSLESSVSDPIILAMIPPPVKKPVPPAATTIKSTVSAPPSSSAPDVKIPKIPQKPPNVEDLLANFEALKRARRGE